MSSRSWLTCPVLVPTAMVREPLNFSALIEGKPWTLATKMGKKTWNHVWNSCRDTSSGERYHVAINASSGWNHLSSRGGSSVRTRFLRGGCSGRSPACPLCSGHEGPSTRLGPGDPTEETSMNGRFEKASNFMTLERFFWTNWDFLRQNNKDNLNFNT